MSKGLNVYLIITVHHVYLISTLNEKRENAVK